jgi:hypothetical protein
MSSKSRACSRKAPALLSRGRVVGGGGIGLTRDPRVNCCGASRSTIIGDGCCLRPEVFRRDFMGR